MKKFTIRKKILSLLLAGTVLFTPLSSIQHDKAYAYKNTEFGNIEFGDVNLDSDVNTADLILLAKNMAGRIGLTDAQKANADICAAPGMDNGSVNADDLLTLIKFLTGEITVLPVGRTPFVPPIEDEPEPFANLSSQQIVDDMGTGWNIGNTLDAWNSNLKDPTPAQTETFWGNLQVSLELIATIKEAGFKTIRVPTTWFQHLAIESDTPYLERTYKIDDDYMARVKEVVDYAYSQGLYVILNLHHEEDWLNNLDPSLNASNKLNDDLTFEENTAMLIDRMSKIWTQIGDNFKNYDEKLIFEGMNEPRTVGSSGEWSGGTQRERLLLNTLNEVFVNTVRTSGGNNDKRHLMVTGYAANGTDGMKDFVFPDSNNLILSVHAYSPYLFALAPDGFSANWGSMVYQTDVWGSAKDKTDLSNEIKNLYDKYVSKGYPVVIGEMGAVDRNTEPNTQARVDWFDFYVKTARDYGMSVVWWDNGAKWDGKGEAFGIIDRTTLEWIFPEIADVVSGKTTSTVTTTSPTVTTTTPTVTTPTVTTPAPNPEMRDISTMQLVKEMGLGINLGNTMEACGDWIDKSNIANFETAWGSPKVTKAMIDGYKAAGFNTVRIPVAWSNLMGANYTINADLLNRVDEIVNYVLDNDMYAIVNIHWDGGWWEGFSTDYNTNINRYRTMWTQISNKFAKYDDKLMFESLNEEGHWDDVWYQWSGGDKEKAFGILNNINQAFVDLIRSSGGNNPDRHLLIAGYSTDITLTCDTLFKMPTDPKNRCAVSVHYYDPFGFTHLEQDESWAQMRLTWGTDQDYADLNASMDKMKTNFVDKEIPVIVGEYGFASKNRTTEEIRKYTVAVCEAIYKRNMCPVLWDVQQDTDRYYYDRTVCKMLDSQLEAQMKAILTK